MGTRETQALILDTARLLFNKYGCARISTNRIAAECGISRGNLYYHFQKKEEIVLCIFQQLVSMVNKKWSEDNSAPTLENLAGMYMRHLNLILEFEFFFREMPALLRQDSLLQRRYREHRNRRINTITKFFLKLADRGIMEFQSDPKLVRSIVIATWIICDNWPNFVEFQGKELNAETICQGYDMVLHVLEPFAKVDFGILTEISHTTIRNMVSRKNKEEPGIYETGT